MATLVKSYSGKQLNVMLFKTGSQYYTLDVFETLQYQVIGPRRNYKIVQQFSIVSTDETNFEAERSSQKKWDDFIGILTEQQVVDIQNFGITNIKELSWAIIKDK